jgi:hypothetical protein
MDGRFEAQTVFTDSGSLETSFPTLYWRMWLWLALMVSAGRRDQVD